MLVCHKPQPTQEGNFCLVLGGGEQKRNHLAIPFKTGWGWGRAMTKQTCPPPSLGGQQALRLHPKTESDRLQQPEEQGSTYNTWLRVRSQGSFWKHSLLVSDPWCHSPLHAPRTRHLQLKALWAHCVQQEGTFQQLRMCSVGPLGG